MPSHEIDPDSPVPLYHQIAEAIRARIASGDLAAGEALEPLREAARTWGVNLHTVRHAYTALARQGLLESQGPRGTRVTAQARPAPTPRLPEFIERIVREARDLYALDARQLSSEIVRQAQASATPADIVYVVECSASQCEAHAREIEGRFEVDAREWSLDRGQEPPRGHIVATYFHYNDIRRLWPHRLGEVAFVTIHPDRGILDRLPAGVERVLVCERDEATAETVASDLSILLGPGGYRVEPVVNLDPVSLVKRQGPGTVALAAPRVWSSLDESAQSHERVLAADYVIDEVDLERLGRKLRWREVAAASRA